jgi:hypothetical protein
MATKYTMAKALKDVGIQKCPKGKTVTGMSKIQIEELYDQAVREGKLEANSWRKYF